MITVFVKITMNEINSYICLILSLILPGGIMECIFVSRYNHTQMFQKYRSTAFSSTCFNKRALVFSKGT